MNHPGYPMYLTDLPQNNLRLTHTSRRSGTMPVFPPLPELTTPPAAFLRLLPWQVDTNPTPPPGHENNLPHSRARRSTTLPTFPLLHSLAYTHALLYAALLRAAKRPEPRTAAPSARHSLRLGLHTYTVKPTVKPTVKLSSGECLDRGVGRGP